MPTRMDVLNRSYSTPSSRSPNNGSLSRSIHTSDRGLPLIPTSPARGEGTWQWRVRPSSSSRSRWGRSRRIPPPPPGTADASPSEPLEKAEKTDSWRLDSPPHSGQGAGSSMRVMGLSFSNRCSQEAQVYSYIGMSVPRLGYHHSSFELAPGQWPRALGPSS